MSQITRKRSRPGLAHSLALDSRFFKADATLRLFDSSNSGGLVWRTAAKAAVASARKAVCSAPGSGP
eukprot:5971520-Alexandrium_andersonii.AAC.1